MRGIIFVLAMLFATSAWGSWYAHTNKNALGEKFHYATSASSGTVDAHMESPYRDSKVRILVTCKAVEFRARPGHLQTGWADYKIDNRPMDSVKLTKHNPDMSYTDSKKFVKTLREGSSIVVRLPWFQERPIFRWSLSGSSAALDDLGQRCGAPIAVARYCFVDFSDVNKTLKCHNSMAGCEADVHQKGLSVRCNELD